MDDKDKNKFEDIASHFHEDDRYYIGNNLHNDNDFNAVEKIFSLRGKVNQLALLSPVREAQGKVNRRIRCRNKSSNKYFRIFRYAAVLFFLVLLSAVAGMVIYRSSLPEEKEIFTEIVSVTGEMKEVALPDGTKVWLGANSTLKYNDSFGQKNRDLVFDGEALFDVAKNEKLAFSVQLESAFITVLGTKFLVTSYAKRSKDEVILLKGKVKYQRDDRRIFMSPGLRLIDNRLKEGIVTDQVELTAYNDWVKGKIYLERKELEDLTFLLEQWYGVKFVFSDRNLAAYKFTGTINKTKPLDYILNIISLTNKVKFQKNGDKIIITK